jgi:thioredoxin 1
VDEVPSLAAKFGITSIPTLIVLEKGKAIAQKVGYCPKAQVLQMLGK